MEDSFKVVIPAEISKSKDGEWRVCGLASTSSKDRQGEIILPGGIDATPIAKGKGFFNWDHDNSPENTVGILDSYKKAENGMYVEGRLFKNHARAKAIYEIMSSLNKGDTGRVGMSVEGKVVRRDPKNPSIITHCIIKNVALTMNPVNTDTFADIVKSMNAGEVEFDSAGQDPVVDATPEATPEATFTASQVMAIVQKALSIGAGNAAAPADRTGGDALGQSDMKADDDKKKKLKRMEKSEIMKSMTTIMDQLQDMYPDYTRAQIWEAVKNRLQTKFPEIKE